MSNKRIVIGFVVLFSLTGCEDENPVASYEYSPPPNIGDGWTTASLQSVGMKESYISNIARNVNNGEYTEMHSVLIVKDDKLVFEEYWPGHDFGFFRYDPVALRHIHPPSLPLWPEAPAMGREIRVIGNDAGEQRSILFRNSPNWAHR